MERGGSFDGLAVPHSTDVLRGQTLILVGDQA